MDNSFQTSFIPKRSLTADNLPIRRSTGLYAIISIVILVGVLVLSGGFFIYKTVLANQKSDLSAKLGLARNSFEQGTISTLELFDKKTATAKQLLTKHIVLSPLFALLGELTIPSVQYTKFEQTNDSKGLSVRLSGLARDYKYIALQSDSFNSPKGRYLKNVVFSNLTKDKNGFVTFDLSFSVDPNLISYEQNALVESAGISPVTPVSLPVAVPASAPATGLETATPEQTPPPSSSNQTN